MKKHYRTDTNCLNCGNQLQGKFCHVCGQENLEIKESFGHVMEHAISDYFHFDHQFFHTLKPLFLNPGKLTNEYMAGKRMQYLHPIKMYIFISLIFFLLIFRDSQETAKVETQPITKSQADSARKVIGQDPAVPVSVKQILTSAIDKKQQASATQRHPDTIKISDFQSKLIKNVSVQDYLKEQAALPAAKRDNFLKKYLIKTMMYYKGNENAKETYTEAFKHNIPKMMFIVLPLFALILKISFWGNNKFYVEHLIHSFHLHCFIFSLIAISLLVDMIVPSAVNGVTDWVQFVVIAAMVWYIYKSLRTVYHRSRFRTISKMIGMFLMYSLVSMLCIVIVAAITGILEVKA